MTFYERSNDAIIASEAWQSNEIDKQSLRDCHITWFLAMTNDYIFRGGDAAPTKSSTTRYVVEFSCGARICGQKKETVVLLHSLREVVQSVVLLSGECRQEYGERIR